MSAQNNNTGDKYNKNAGTRRNNNFGQQRRNYGNNPSNGNVPQDSNNVAQQRHYVPQHRRNFAPAEARNTENKNENQSSDQGHRDVQQQHRHNYGQHRGHYVQHRRQNYAPNYANNSMPEEGAANVRPYRHNNYYQRRNYGQQRRGNGHGFVQNNTESQKVATDAPNNTSHEVVPEENNVPQQVQKSVVPTNYRNALLTNLRVQHVADINEPKIVNEVPESGNIASEQALDNVAPQIKDVAQQVNNVDQEVDNIAQQVKNVDLQINADVPQYFYAEPESCNVYSPQVLDNNLPSPSYNALPFMDYVQPKPQNYFLTPKGGFHVINFIKLDKFGQEFIVPSCFNLGWNTADERHILLDRVMRQLEFYLSEENLSTDEFMKKLLNCQGWVQIKDIMPFRRLQGLTKDYNVILAAVMSSQKMELSEDMTMIRRKVFSN